MNRSWQSTVSIVIGGLVIIAMLLIAILSVLNTWNDAPSAASGPIADSLLESGGIARPSLRAGTPKQRPITLPPPRSPQPEPEAQPEPKIADETGIDVSGVVLHHSTNQRIPHVTVTVYPASAIQITSMATFGIGDLDFIDVLDDGKTRKRSEKRERAEKFFSGLLYYGTPIRVNYSTLDSLSTSTNAFGEFTLSGISPGKYIAVVHSDEFSSVGPLPLYAPDISVDTHIGGGLVFDILENLPSADLVVFALPTENVEGDMYNNSLARGIPGVAVMAFRYANDPNVIVYEGTSFTDENGAYRLDNLPPGEYLLVRDFVDGYTGLGDLFHRFNPAHRSRNGPFNFVFFEQSLLTGSLLLGDTPAENREFHLFYIHIEDEVRLNVSILRPLVEGPIRTNNEAIYQEDNIKAMDAFVLGQLFTSTGSSRLSLTTFASIQDAEVNLVDIEFAWGTSSISGVVLSVLGTPIIDATVSRTPNHYNGATDHIRTDDLGEFVFEDVPAGDHTISVFLPDTLDGITKQATVEPEENYATNIHVPLEPIPVTIANPPRDTAFMWVRVMEEGIRPDFSSILKGELFNRTHAIADSVAENNRCNIYGLAPGTYSVYARSWPCDPWAVYFFNEVQIAKFMKLSRVVRRRVTVEAGKPLPELSFDFRGSTTSLELQRLGVSG